LTKRKEIWFAERVQVVGPGRRVCHGTCGTNVAQAGRQAGRHSCKRAAFCCAAFDTSWRPRSRPGAPRRRAGSSRAAPGVVGVKQAAFRISVAARLPTWRVAHSRPARDTSPLRLLEVVSAFPSPQWRGDLELLRWPRGQAALPTIKISMEPEEHAFMLLIFANSAGARPQSRASGASREATAGP